MVVSRVAACIRLFGASGAFDDLCHSVTKEILHFCLLSFCRGGLEKAKKELAGSIEKGISFARK